MTRSGNVETGSAPSTLTVANCHDPQNPEIGSSLGGWSTTLASKTQIEIFGSARRPREAQFNSECAFQVVDIDDTFLDGALRRRVSAEAFSALM
jgi:hypothetical protein